jgi:hypothetical protein
MREQTRNGKPAASGVRHWVLSVLLLLSVILSAVTSVDRMAEADHKELFQRALITFALARTLNGVISAVQGTELALQPAGVGVTLTPGQILDPVNDLVERFSWIMLGATLSLGIQQVFLDVGQWWGIRVLVAVLGLLWLWARISKATRPHSLLGNSEQTLLRVFIIVFFLRFAVPVALIANEALYGLFLESRYQESAQVIETAGTQIEKVSARPLIEEPGEETSLIETLERALDSTREALDIRRRVEFIKERAAELFEHMIQLSVIFILQTGILPIAFLWLFLQLFKQLFRGGWSP